MTINQRILRDTLEITLAKDDTFPKRFYEILFAAHPQAKPMFHRNSQGAQLKMFAQKLTAIVDHIGDPEWLDRELKPLATNHVHYGVRADMYSWVGDALIQALREACADAWSTEAEASWNAAYGALRDAMLSAAPHQK
jgi:hemoglobin-like flavoprotein